MMNSLKFNLKLSNYLIITVFLASSHQTVAKAEYEKASITTNEKYFAKLNENIAINPSETKCQKDWSACLKELQNSAKIVSNLTVGEVGQFDITKALPKIFFGFLCSQKFENTKNQIFDRNLFEKIDELRTNFCQTLQDGEKLDELMEPENVENTAINLFENLSSEPKIFKYIQQQIAINVFLNDSNKKKMAQIMDHFALGTQKFYGFVKANSPTPSDDANKISQMTRRQKRNPLKKHPIKFNIVVLCALIVAVFGILEVTHLGKSNPFALYNIVACAVLFVILCLLGAYIVRLSAQESGPDHESGDDNA